jgi:HPt (histidine-containing phosphotransfer) domain-containing protein
MQEDAQTRTARLIADLWRKNQPQIRERIASLETTAAAAANGSLTPAQRNDAQSLSHKLAGSLGMFGYPEGTRIARALEDAFHVERPDPVLLAALVRDLRATLFPRETITPITGN